MPVGLTAIMAHRKLSVVVKLCPSALFPGHKKVFVSSSLVPVPGSPLRVTAVKRCLNGKGVWWYGNNGIFGIASTILNQIQAMETTYLYLEVRQPPAVPRVLV